MKTLYDHAGVIHLHSAYSFDGRAPVSRIMAAARACGLDFVMLTDHDTLQARADGLEGWHGQTLLVVGQEIAPRFNHYLAFGTREAIVVPADGQEESPQAYIDRVQAQGGIGFVAHPDHEGAPLFHVKHYPWIDWDVQGFTGMGIWDFMTDWQSRLEGYGRALAAYLFPALALRGPREVTLARWDALNRRRRVVGIAELDNHDTPKRIGGLTLPVFPFRRVVGLVRTHILTEAPLRGEGSDAAALLSALARGRAFAAMEGFREARGFQVWFAAGNADATMGDAAVFRGEGRLAVTLPSPGLMRCVRDGVFFGEKKGREASWPITAPGVYRIEVRQRVFGKWLPWIYGNPLRLLPPGETAVSG